MCDAVRKRVIESLDEKVELAKTWRERADFIERDKYAQAEDYREAITWRKAADELCGCIGQQRAGKGE